MLVRLWQSRWTPACFVLLLGLGYYGAKRFDQRYIHRESYDLPTDLLIRGNPDLREVALTIDDGPYGKTTSEILDTLRKEDVKATFFVVGRHVDEHPDLVRQMMAEGHEVGNHTYTHPRLTQITLQQARVELEECEDAVFRATGAHMDLMRPPGMNYDERLLHLAQDMGYTTVHWNAVAGDYLPVKPEMIMKRILWQTHPGSVILLHDTEETSQALPRLIERLKSDGYRFVTVTQMLARLPRPVFLASNAGAVPLTTETKPEPTVKRHRAVKAKPRSAAKTPGTEDAPTWDGGNQDEESILVRLENQRFAVYAEA
ncbi:MAG TPA: polysaccharide deacetylase family protein [Fimbriimonadaceae bacterium]|nr:polysaccharide deacetylase family protein [Fimbriimonadaceae bacterium]